MIISNSKRASEISEILINAYKKDGIFGHRVGEFPDLLCPKEIEKGSNEHLIYVSLLVSLDYMRNANILWEAGLKAYNNINTKWIFNLLEIKNHTKEDLSKVLFENKISLKPIRDFNIWKTITESINSLMNGSLSNFIINDCQSDAILIFYNIKYRYRKFFPNLSGDKILPLWIRILKDFCGLNLKNLDKILIPVDIHIARTTFYTGCLTSDHNVTLSIDNIKYEIDKVWEEAVSLKNDTIKLDMDEPLWILGRYGCTKLSNSHCPKYDDCLVKSYCLAVKKNISVSHGKNGIHL